MNISPTFRRFLNSACEFGLKDRAAFLRNVSTVGWVLSSVAQVAAIVINDDIPTKEKKFMIPQEIIDGITNITLFWVCTSRAMDFGKYLVKSGKILPKSLEAFKGKKVSAEIIENAKEIGGKVIDNKTKRLLIDDFNKTTDGIGLLTSMVGSVIASNLITPLVRNKFASIYQKNHIEKENNKQTRLNENFGNIDLNTIGKKFERKSSPISVNYNPYALYNSYNSSMKI